MKAVVWTDSVQMLILIAGLVTLIIKGMIACGGLSNVLNTANNGGRIEFSR
jgi:Na+/proline symporter